LAGALFDGKTELDGNLKNNMMDESYVSSLKYVVSLIEGTDDGLNNKIESLVKEDKNIEVAQLAGLDKVRDISDDDKNIKVNEAIYAQEAALREELKKESPDPVAMAIAVAKTAWMLDTFADRRNAIDIKEVRNAALVTNIESVFDLKAAM
jgi:hypothetical protein